MRKVIRLNERDLTRIIKRVINEQIKTIDPTEVIPPSPYVDPKEIVDKLKQLLDSMRDDDVLDKTDEDLFKDLFNAFKVQKKGAIYDSETLTFYTIKSGDTLSKIANSFGTTVNKIMELNPKITDPNKITAGQQIKIKN